ncbi:MAG: carbohydrate ABC transporter permease, partial [Anaerolineaceae bacterium]|nr:carbohydrate ABC transporter permease [Anaerolineaceae bacterium]
MKKIKLSRILAYIALIAVIIFYAAPLFIVISTSLKTDTQTMSSQFEWIPNPVTLEQYKIVLERFPFTKWLRNSLFVTAG